MVKSALYSLIFGGLCLGCIACTDHDGVSVQENVQVQVGFTLSTGSYGSRAGHGTATDVEGTGYENYIDVAGRDFRFYIFDANNEFVDDLEVTSVLPIDNTQYPTTYYVTGELNDIPPTGEDFKVVVITNWDRYPASSELVKGTTTIEDICEASDYTYQHPFIPSATQKIPMYGVKTCTGLEFKANLLTDLGTINMLRAMAKVEVKLASGISAFTLESVNLHYFTEHGMAAPHGIYDNTGGNCTSDELHMDHNYTVNTEPIAFPIAPSGNNGWMIYIPEYKNVGFDYPSYITVTIGHDGHTKDGEIYFCNYADGKPKEDEPIDIVRNHHYQYTITSVGGGISVQYTVADWIHNEDDHHWTQNYSYPTYENLVPWDERNETEEIEYPETPTMYYVASNFDADGKLKDTEGAFVVGFKMTGPSGQTWAPAIHGSSDHYVMKVYHEENGTLVELPQKTNETENWIAADTWYQIKLIPKNPDMVNQTVDFGITTTLDWAGQSVFLLINGEDEKSIRWPNSGNDARIIQVQQVAAPTNNENNDT